MDNEKEVIDIYEGDATVNDTDENSAEQYGTPRHSGRYPWGSGENPYQHNQQFLHQVAAYRKQGMSDKDIAEIFNFKNSSELRAKVSAASNQNKKMDIAQINKLREKYPDMGATEIGRRTGLAESTVRSLMRQKTQERAHLTTDTIDILKQRVSEDKYIDVGKGTEVQLDIADTRLQNALRELENQGYSIQEIKYEQVTNPGKYTTMKVLAAPGVTRDEISKNRDQIKTVSKNGEGEYDNTEVTNLNIKKPVSIDSSRVLIRYAEDLDANGVPGIDRDGMMQIRRGLKDINLGDDIYAQVRIAVDDKSYLKGMAVYGDDIPAGYDIVFNTNKPRGTAFDKVLKPLKKVNPDDDNSPVDWDNPFGATIKKQLEYDGADGKKHLSPVNIVNKEGDWDEWARTLSSQFLAKQSEQLIKQQLDIAYKDRQTQYEDILNIPNMTIRNKMLVDFADGCDGAAVDLKGAAMSRQAPHVILPVPSLKENECYAPKYENGEKLVLVRFPHAGKFESPELIVNNNNPEAKKFMFNAKDAIGINPKAASQLSGADFDGDTVVVLPNNKGMIQVEKPLAGLKGFSTDEYKNPEGAPKTSAKNGFRKQMQMGIVSNLITDMTLVGATEDEYVRAVKHSMVIIDAEKHNLDWRRSERENNIADLHLKYQGKARGGAKTLVAKASGEYDVKERRVLTSIDPETGEKVFYETGRTYVDRKGKVRDVMQKSTKMAETKDAYTLSSGTEKEAIYADYANSLKAMANSARKESLKKAKEPEYSPSAAAKYKTEVSSLLAGLNRALKNAPYERQAQLAANEIAKVKIKANPNMSKDEKSRIKAQALSAQRVRYGAHRRYITPTDSEWNAIMAGALRPTVVAKIINNMKDEELKKRTTPRQQTEIGTSKENLIRSLSRAGYSISEIAERLDISTSTVSNHL